MAQFCYACHRISEEKKDDCDYDSFELKEADCTLPESIELDGQKFEFLECTFPGENIKAYRVRDVENYDNYLYASINSDIVNNEEFDAWFSARAKFRHENVLSCIKYGALPTGQHYILSELPQGETLLEALKTDGEMKAKICVYVADQILDALIALKKEGIFHGNVMPSKCLLIQDAKKANLLKLGGISIPDKCFNNLEDKPDKRFPETVSPLYISPERAEGAPPCEKSEIYSVGALMYECFSGIPAYTADSHEKLLKAHKEGHVLPLRGVAPELDIPAMLDDLVLKAMSKDPKDRFDSFEHMSAHLMEAAERSRIYVLEDEEKDRKFMPPVIYKRLTQENPVLTEEAIERMEQIKEEEKLKAEQEAARERAELRHTARELNKTNKALIVVSVVAIFCVIYLLLKQ